MPVGSEAYTNFAKVLGRKIKHQLITWFSLQVVFEHICILFHIDYYNTILSFNGQGRCTNVCLKVYT